VCHLTTYFTFQPDSRPPARHQVKARVKLRGKHPPMNSHAINGLAIASADVQPFAKTLAGSSDLTIALVGAGFVDNCLRSLLLARLRPGDTSQNLFHPGRGPLRTLFTRANLAYSLRYIEKDELQTLHTISNTRTVFAHAQTELTFDDPQIAELCNELDYIDARVLHDSPTAISDRVSADPPQPLRARERFFFTALVLSDHLLTLKQQ
jgi:hypothetical protein